MVGAIITRAAAEEEEEQKPGAPGTAPAPAGFFCDCLCTYLLHLLLHTSLWFDLKLCRLQPGTQGGLQFNCRKEVFFQKPCILLLNPVQ